MQRLILIFLFLYLYSLAIEYLLRKVSFQSICSTNFVELKNLKREKSFWENGQENIIILPIFQMVVPKRAAMLLDRIMVALHHAFEDNDREGIQRIANIHKSSRYPGSNIRFQKEMMQQFNG